jgi:hypothetical protein
LNKFPSLPHMLRAAYPNHFWETSKFVSPKKRVSRWSDKNNQRKFLASIAPSLGIAEVRVNQSFDFIDLIYLSFIQPSDWYRISRRDVCRLGGRPLFNIYETLEEILKAVYPSVSWESNKFLHRPRTIYPPGYWKNKENLIKAIDNAEKQLGIISVCYFMLISF